MFRSEFGHQDKIMSLNLQEMKQWILRSFHLLNVEESEERFSDHDQDSDGSISWKEYMMEERINT